MNEDHFYIIQRQYAQSRGDSMALFHRILEIAGESSLDEALEILERCVCAKRLAWVEKHPEQRAHTGNPLRDGLRMFYEDYMGLTMPQDGEIVEESDMKIVTR